jgi:leucyl/phenylalanyl-tRNA--protein transferase
MTVTAFPAVELADEDGVLCVGGDLDVDSLLLSYRSGIFPWPLSDDYPMVWFAPPKRALLFIKEVRIPRSLRRERKKAWSFSIDKSCPEVIEGCRSTPRQKGKRKTWITTEMLSAYTRLHHAGWCHSVESWYGDELAGGLYGVAIGGMFAGESMFHRVSNASKLALWYLVEQIEEWGGEWIDCQQLTPLLMSFGAREVPRAQYMELLSEATNSRHTLFLTTPSAY